MPEAKTYEVVHVETTRLVSAAGFDGPPMPTGRRWRMTFLGQPDCQGTVLAVEIQTTPDGAWEPQDIGQHQWVLIGDETFKIARTEVA